MPLLSSHSLCCRNSLASFCLESMRRPLNFVRRATRRAGSRVPRTMSSTERGSSSPCRLCVVTPPPTCASRARAAAYSMSRCWSSPFPSPSGGRLGVAMDVHSIRGGCWGSSCNPPHCMPPHPTHDMHRSVSEAQWAQYHAEDSSPPTPPPNPTPAKRVQAVDTRVLLSRTTERRATTDVARLVTCITQRRPEQLGCN